ncbi:DUF211 domain-containing protein [Halobaculum gomorrense]|uniref:DUF211 domain-containing protein n=1 Tax=Halobaculum gomorrense TaxID=43928 RepID=A0A1M5NYT0_9EURY|nr:DUF211 domain-containing protein [Halobaculum gomorrense]SHG94690.1 hypothetical protein SAMN05443636_1395 [Halobaculum gomorrense]
MATVRKVVVDVLKPHAPPLVEFTERVSETAGVDSASSRLIELDRDVQNIEVTVEGVDVDYGAVVDAVEGIGATVHSVDEVVCGDGPSTDTFAAESDG